MESGRNGNKLVSGLISNFLLRRVNFRNLGSLERFSVQIL